MPKEHTTSKKIEEAARKLFAEKGFSATSMSDIASNVGITKASLYYFFTNKEDLYCSLLQRAIGEASAYVEALLHKERKTDEVEIMISELLDIGARNKLFIHPPDNSMLREKNKDLFQLINGFQKNVLAVMVRNNVSEPELATDVLFFSLQGYMRRKACRCPVSESQIFAKYLSNCIITSQK